MLDRVSSDEQRFSEILVRALTQGIAFYGRGGMSPGGISFEGKRLVVLVTDGNGHVISPTDSATTEPGPVDLNAPSKQE